MVVCGCRIAYFCTSCGRLISCIFCLISPCVPRHNIVSTTHNSRLTESKTALTAQLTEIQTESKLSGSSAIPLRLELERVKTELGSITTHSDWLGNELTARNDALAKLREKYGKDVAKAQSDLENVRYELDEVQAKLAGSKSREDKLRSDLEASENRRREQEREAIDAQQSLEEELLNERRLVDLAKDAKDRMQARYEQTRKEMESMKKLAVAAEADARAEMDRLVAEAEERGRLALVEADEEHARATERLEAKLQEAEEGRKRIEDGLLSTPTPLRRRKSKRLAIAAEGASDAADGQAGGAEEEEGPLSLTDLYEAKAAVEDELLYERRERARLELYLKKIQLDIESKTPEIRRRQRVYEVAIQAQDELKARLSQALDEAEMARGEQQNLVVEKGQLETSCRDLRTENTDLAKQVQALLRAQAGAAAGSTDDDIVEFQSIDDLQVRNQRLLREHRRLNNKVAELEKELKTDETQAKLADCQAQLAVLREEREKQATLVAGIVQQRDLYRALVAKHDGNLLTSPDGQGGSRATLALTDRASSLQEDNKKLNDEVARLTAELSAAKSNQEALEERLARLDAHATDLSASVQRLNGSLMAANSSTARAEADASYHQDRSKRLEIQLEDIRKELANASAARQELDKVNATLQESLAEAKADSSRNEMQLRQVEAQLRLAETQVQTVRSSETRLANDGNQLRAELAKQGALLDSVQRIEASLSAKSAADAERLEDDLKRNIELLTSERTKHSAETEKLQGKISDLEVLLKEQETKKNDALTNMVKAKEDLVQARSDHQALSERCTGLELSLSQAKRKLGEADEDDDGEDKLATLGADLESARSQLATAKERIEDLQDIAKSNETALADLTKASDEYKKKAEAEVEKLKKELEATKRTAKTKQDMLDELGKDLASSRGEQEKVVSDLKAKIEAMEAEVASAKQDAEAAQSRMEAIVSEMKTYQADAAAAQNNYERELALHANARTELRSAREEYEGEIRLRQTAESQLETTRTEFEGEKKIWEESKSRLEESFKETEKRLEEVRSQNNLLHSQMETLTATVEKYQNDKIAAVPEEGTAESGAAESAEDSSVLRKTVSDLREMVRFLRSEREMYEAQLESSRRTSERERAAAAVTKRSLDEARAELQVLHTRAGDATDKENARSAGEREADATRIRKADEQLVLLRESNKLLREEAEKTAKSLQEAQKELSAKKKSAAPTEAKCRQLQVDKSALEAEKASLAREVDAWKGRVQSLVSKFNTIDPEEHAQALASVEASKKEVESLKSIKARVEKEAASAKNLVSRLNKELTQRKTELEAAKTSLAKVTAEKNSLSKKSSAADTSLAKERLQLKQALKNKEEELASSKAEMESANNRIEGLKKIMGKLKQQNVDMQKKSKAAEAKQQETEKALEKEHEVLKEKQAELAKAKAKTSAPARAPSPAPAAAPAPAAPKSKASTTASDAASTKKPQPPKVPAGGFKFAPSPVDGKSTAAGTTSTTAEAKSTSKPASKPSSRAPSPAVAPADKQIAPKTSSGTTLTADATAKDTDASKSKSGDGKFAAAALKEKQLSAMRQKENAMRERLMRKKRQLEEAASKKPSDDDEKGSAPPEKRAAKTSEADKPADAKSTEKPSDATAAAEADTQKGGEETDDSSSTDDEQDNISATASSGKSMFGSQQSPAFGSSGFGSAALGPSASLRFGSSSTVARGGSGIGSGTSTPPLFGKGTAVTARDTGSGDDDNDDDDNSKEKEERGVFLNLKPPGSGAAPGQFVFGTSASIALPLPKPASAQPAPTTGFGTFGQTAAGGVKASPFGSAASSSGLTFGSSATTTKRPAADAEEGAESAPKQPRVEEKDEDSAGGDDDDDDTEDGEVEE